MIIYRNGVYISKYQLGKFYKEIKAFTHMGEKKWFVYILECSDGSFYTGVTNDLDKRMGVHASGKGSKYVREKGFRKLLRSMECKDKSEACRFEYEIKQLPRSEKMGWFDENRDYLL